MSRRYTIMFTPVGWQVVDTEESRDAMAEYGTGPDEYARALLEAHRLNTGIDYDVDQEESA